MKMKGGLNPLSDWRWFLLVAVLGCLIGWILFKGVRRCWWRREAFQSDIPADSLGPDPSARDDLNPAKWSTCTPTTDKAVITSRFWAYVDGLATKQVEGTTSMIDTIRLVTDPLDPDTYQVIFPTYVSVYALAKYGGIKNERCARRALFDEYDSLMKDLTTTVYDRSKVAAWDADPKAQTCVALKVIEGNIAQAVSNMRRNIQDVSGTTVTLAALRDENLGLQNKFLQACTATTPPNQPCIQLASQEPILFPLLSQYEGVSSAAYEKEGDLNESLQAVSDTYKILGCTAGVGTRFDFDSDRDVGQIDAETLRIKLQTLSPYYLSPDTLKYITEAIIKPADVQDSLMNTADVLARVNLSVKNIKGITGVA
jgi:hypothetical protein